MIINNQIQLKYFNKDKNEIKDNYYISSYIYKSNEYENIIWNLIFLDIID